MTGRGLALAATLLALAAAPAAAQVFEPVPIGPGPEYQPAARWPLAGAATFGGLHGDVYAPARAHLELFADRHVVVVPGGIGVSGGRTQRYGFVTEALWTAPAWTLQPGGVIELGRPGLTLADFFAVWGRPLASDRLLGWRGRVRAVVNGAEYTGDPATIPLRDGDQIVLMIGGEVEAHPRFTFTPRPRL